MLKRSVQIIRKDGLKAFIKSGVSFSKSLSHRVSGHPTMIYYKKAYRCFKSRLFYKAVADPDKNIWVAVKDLKFPIGEKIGVKRKRTGDIVGGDWDLDVVTFEQFLERNWDMDTKISQHKIKFKSIFQHFRQGIPWEQTDLFQIDYINRLKDERSYSTIQELVNKYNKEIIELYKSIKENGVLPCSKEHPEIGKVYVHIGRKGEIIKGEQGQHRLAIAMLLNIEFLPFRVRARHKEWQDIREIVYHKVSSGCQDGIDVNLLKHPDLQDIIRRDE